MGDKEYDDYYYRLGRHQGVIELIEGIIKSVPFGITKQQMKDWQQGYDEGQEGFHWRRKRAAEEQK